MKKSAPMDYDKALLLMCDLCARCEQCEADLREKMRKRQLPSADIERVIAYLYDHNFLNEERFARAYARDKHRFNGWGKIKIRLMLASKRVSGEAIKQALDELDEREYLDNLLRITRAKARSLNLQEHTDRQKLLRSIYSKGYEPPLIIEAIRRLRQDAD